MRIDGKGGAFTEDITPSGPMHCAKGVVIVWCETNPAMILRMALAANERLPGTPERERLSTAITHAIEAA